MGNGILAQAAARLPSSMGGTTATAPSGAQRNVPASFTGGQGTSLGIYQPPKKRRGGGGGGIKLKPKKKAPPKGLVDDWKETLKQLQTNIDKGYISKEQAQAIKEKLQPLYEELGEKYGQPHQYSQELKDAISKYGNIRDGVDYESVKALRENPTNLKTGKPNIAHKSNYPDNPQTVKEQFAAAKEAALARGDWAAAEEMGASTSEIVARGGILLGTKEVTEGPETSTVNVWGGEPTVDTSGDGFGAGATDYWDQVEEDSGWTQEDQQSFLEDTAHDWGEDHDPWSQDSSDTNFPDFDLTDASTFTDDGGAFSDSDSLTSGDQTISGGAGNKGGYVQSKQRGGIIRRAGGGGVPVADPRNFPGKPMGTDRVPVWAEDGEYVVTREGTKKFKPLLDKINAYRPPSGTVDGAMSQMDDLINKYAQGGKVR